MARVRYLDMGPSPQGISGEAAMAPGRALAQAGQVISGVAQQGFAIAERVRKIDETGKITAYFANMDQKANEFANSLYTRQDTSEWPQEWKVMQDGLRMDAKDMKLSREAQAEFDNRFANWSTDKSEYFARASMIKGVELGRARIGQSVKYNQARGQFAEAEQNIRDAHASTLMNDVERDQALDQNQQLATRYGLEQLPSQELKKQLDSGAVKDLPGWTIDVEKDAREFLKMKERDDMNLAIDQFNDANSQNQFTDENQIDTVFKDRVPPRIIAKMKEDFRFQKSEEFKKLQAFPSYQNQVRGMAMELIEDFNAEVADYDEKAVQINALIRRLPEGDPSRTELQNYFNDKRNGQLEEYKTTSQQMRKQLVTAYKDGFFTPPVKEQSVQSRLDAGLLKNKETLLEAGFSEDQADKIVNADKDRDRLALFRQTYPIREKKNIAKDPFRQASYEAIQRGDTTIRYIDPVAQAEAARNLGEATKKLDVWLKENPDKATDGEAMSKKMGEIVAPFGVKNFQAIVLPPVPAFMNGDAPLLQPTEGNNVDPFLPR